MAASDDSDDKECPLCMEPLELDDINFYPCTCEYQICRFCWHRIRTDENGLCPACRKPYPENPVNFKPLSQDELKKIAQEKKQKEFQRKQKVSESRKHLTNIRVVQKNLVFVVGLAARLADAEILKRNEYFGKFGRIQKVMVNNQSSYVGQQGPSASAYVTYFKAEDALRCIQCVNNLQFDGRTMKACLGTTKYCSMFLKNQSCSKQKYVMEDCMYLHELGDEAASFTKEEMQQGKHTEYERKLIDQILSMLPSQDHRRPGSVSPSSLAWSDDRLRKAERDDNGSFSDESINAITGVGGVQRSSSNNKVNCSYVSGGKNENVAAGLRPFNEHTTAQRKRYKAFRSRSPGAKQQIHHHHHSSAAPGSNKERTFVSNGGGGVGGGISNIPPRLQYLHGQGAGGGAGYCRTHHSGCGNGGRSLVKTRGRRRENNRFLDDEFLTSAAKETTRSASADATSRHSTSTSNSQSPSPVPPQVSNDEKASAVVDAGGNLDDLTVVDIGAAGRLSKGAGGAGGLMVMTGSNKAADKQQFGSSFGCQNEPTSTSTAGVVMQTSLSTSSLSSLPIVATDLVENQLMAAFQSSLANCKTLDATGLVEDLSQVNFPTQCSNYDSVAGQSSSSYSWQNNSQNNRAATSSVVDWQAVFGFNGSTETPINAISALLQPANTPQLPPHHTAGAVLKERNCGAEQSVPVNIVNGFGAGADSDNINMSPSQNVQQQQQRFPSGDLPSTSSLRNFSVDDDLGFDPFAESSKGLEDMLRMEQQQQQASQSESSRTLGGGAHQFANMFNSSKSAAISSNHDFHKHSLPFFHHHPGGQHHPGCQPHPGGAISSSFPTSTMSQQQMQHPAMHNRLSATAGQMSVPGTNGTMVNNMKFNAMRFPPNGISSPPGENMLSEFASHSEKGSRFQTDFPVGMQQPMFGSGWSGNAGSNGLMSPQPPYAARPNHLSMSSGSSQQSPHCGSLQSGTPKEQSLSFKEWQDGLRQLFPSVNVQFAPNLKPQGLQPSNVDGCMPSATNLASPGGIPPKNVPGPQMRSGFPPPSLHRGMMRFPPPPIPGGMPPMPPSSGSPFVNRHLHFGPNQSQNGMRPHWKESQLRGQTVTMAQDTPDWSLLPIPPPGFSSL